MGEHALSCAALDAALESARTGELLFSEALAVRARALVGKAAAASPHWDIGTGKQRVLDVMKQMDGDRVLLEKLLLRGL